MDESISISKFKDVVSNCLNRIQYKGERFLLERHHKNCAALVSLSDYEYLNEIKALRSSKIHRIYEHEVKTLIELLNSTGAEYLNEFLCACQDNKILNEIKSNVDYNRKMTNAERGKGVSKLQKDKDGKVKKS